MKTLELQKLQKLVDSNEEADPNTSTMRCRISRSWIRRDSYRSVNMFGDLG